MSGIRRKSIGHEIPDWVDAGSLFFVTICCEDRESSNLTTGTVPQALLDSIRFYHEKQKWFCRIALLMPDHVHMLVSFPGEQGMAKAVSDWKKYTSRAMGLSWQKNFFDHRVRNGENWELKADYIRMNPVRKGLVERADQWLHLFEAER